MQTEIVDDKELIRYMVDMDENNEYEQEIAYIEYENIQFHLKEIVEGIYRLGSER